MLGQTVATLVSLTLGSVLTLVIAYFTQAMNTKGERRKIKRGKLEDLYTMTFRLKNWAEDTKDRLCILYESPPRTRFVPSTLVCPINEIEILTRIYAPSMKEATTKLHGSVHRLKTVLTKFADDTEDFSDIDDERAQCTYNEYFAELVQKSYDEINANIDGFMSMTEKLISKS